MYKRYFVVITSHKNTYIIANFKKLLWYLIHSNFVKLFSFQHQYILCSFHSNDTWIVPCTLHFTLVINVLLFKLVSKRCTCIWNNNYFPLLYLHISYVFIWIIFLKYMSVLKASNSMASNWFGGTIIHSPQYMIYAV